MKFKTFNENFLKVLENILRKFKENYRKLIKTRKC